MKIAKRMVSVVAMAAVCSLGAMAEAQNSEADILSQEQVDQLVEDAKSAGISSENFEIKYVGGDEVVETKECCDTIEEKVTEQDEYRTTTVEIDAVTERETIQPIEKTVIQPIDKRIARGTTEVVTEETHYETETLPIIVKADSVPDVTETVVTEETTEIVESVEEVYVDVVTTREVIQPIERVTIVPVERQILRPRTEHITEETIYKTIKGKKKIKEAPYVEVKEYTTEQLNVIEKEELQESYVDYVSERKVIQPVEKTIIQPVELRRLNGISETVTAPTKYVEETLPTRYETSDRQDVVETVVPVITEKTVYEVKDVYVDQVSRHIVKPVVVTRVYPVERRIINPRKETVTAPVRYQTEYRPVKVIEADIPETVTTYEPRVNVTEKEEITETYFDAVTHRKVIQPVHTKYIQPIRIEKVRGVKETITAPVKYETVRAEEVIMASDCGCSCNCCHHVAHEHDDCGHGHHGAHHSKHHEELYGN